MGRISRAVPIQEPAGQYSSVTRYEGSIGRMAFALAVRAGEVGSEFAHVPVIRRIALPVSTDHNRPWRSPEPTKRRHDSVDVGGGQLRPVRHELRLVDRHATPGIDAHPPAAERSAVFGVRRPAREVIELDVRINGRLRHPTLRRIERERLPGAVDVEHEGRLTYRRNDNRGVVGRSGKLDWRNRFHGEANPITRLAPSGQSRRP